MMSTISLAKLLFCSTIYSPWDSNSNQGVSQEARMECKVGGYKIATIVLPSGKQRAVILLIIISN